MAIVSSAILILYEMTIETMNLLLKGLGYCALKQMCMGVLRLMDQILNII